MGKINGLEELSQVPPKVRSMYMAVIQMLEEGVDAANIHVSDITERAGIGKGTAYEYFDSREEIVACAMVYQVQWMFGCLREALTERESFEEQLFYLLDEIEKRDGQKNCLLRFVHRMTDNSEFSRLVREKLKSEEFAPYLLVNVFADVLERGRRRGELRRDLPVSYMVYSLFAHLLTYVLAVSAEGFVPADQETIRTLSYQGILRELGAYQN